MYDTDFMAQTFALKKKIISGQVDSSEAGKLFEMFEQLRRSKPMVFNIETTSVCNMRCVMCQRTTDMKRKPRKMPMEVFGRVVEQMEPVASEDYRNWQKFVNANLREGEAPSENNYYFDIISNGVTLHGFGEPLLDPDLPERVALLSAKGINSYFSVNPCNIKLDFISALFEAGATHIKFAMDSLDDDMAREIRGGSADFTQSYQNVLDVLELKKKMGAETTIVMTMLDMSGDPTVLGKFLALWEGKDVYAYGKSIDNQWLLKDKEVEQGADVDNKSHYKKQYCEFPWTSVTILEDGSVVPCTQDINATWNFGNVMEQSLEEIWNGPKYEEFRKLHLSRDYSEDFMCHKNCDLDLLSYFYEDAK